MFKPVRNRRTYWLFTPTIAFFYCVVFALAVNSVAIYINGAWDKAPPTIRIAQLLEKKNPTANFVQSWREGHENERIVLNDELRKNVVPGKSKLRIVTKPDRLGYEWIVDCTLVPDEF